MSAQKLPKQDVKWTKGDFELVSRDGVKFVVHTYHLQSASRVFRDMIEAGSGAKRIQLDESAKTIRHFLKLATEGSSWFDTDSSEAADYAQVVDLVHFLTKYECEAAIGHLKQCVVAFPVDKITHHATLRMLAGMHLGMPAACAAILRAHPDMFKGLCPVYSEAHKIPDMMPLEVFQLIPLKYLWAIVAAYRHGSGTGFVSARGAPIDLGERFLHYMK